MSELVTTYKAKFHAAASMGLLLLSIISGQSSLLLVGIFSTMLTLFILFNKGLRLNRIDIAILLLFVYEVILGNTQYGYNNGLRPILTQFIFTAFYFIVRLSMRERATAKMLLKWVSVFFIIASLFCVISFLIFCYNVLSAGFDTLSDFKFLYRPFGNLNNVWATFLLCFLLIYLLYIIFYGARKRFVAWLVCSMPLLYCLIVSFSRGIYICMGIIIVVLLVLLITSLKFNIKFKLIAIVSSALSLTALSFLHKDEVLQTAKLTETISQQRSLDSRVSSLSYLKPAMSELSIWGAGTANYPMAMDKYIYQNDDNTYTNFAPNIISQLLIEKGVIGTSLWVLLVVFVVVSFWRTDKKTRKEQLFILFTLAILFLRELSFPALLTTLGLQLMFALLIGIYANNLTAKVAKCKHYRVISSAIILVVFVYCAMLNAQYSAYSANIAQFKENFEKGDYVAAGQNLAKCRQTIPTLVYHATLHKKKYLENGDIREIEKACKYMCEAVVANPLDIRLKYDDAMTLYLSRQTRIAKYMLQELCDSFPDNSLMHATLGNIFYHNGDKKAAIFHFAKAIELTPAVLESSVWTKFKEADSLSCRLILNEIDADMQNRGDDPIKHAKYGKIMFLAGRYDEAEALSSKALEALPNLQSPWVCLWKIALAKGDPKADEYLAKAKLFLFDENEERAEEKQSVIFKNGPFPTDPELYAYYGMKFQSWYATEWLPETVIF